jgi:hypothetical protein
VHERVLLQFRHPQELVDAERAGSVKVQLFALEKEQQKRPVMVYCLLGSALQLTISFLVVSARRLQLKFNKNKTGQMGVISRTNKSSCVQWAARLSLGKASSLP